MGERLEGPKGLVPAFPNPLERSCRPREFPTGTGVKTLEPRLEPLKPLGITG
jgi:hypothetical protein